jgi:FtsP/CotA-like multicopper oxidase with cupredoxin domain
VYGDFMEHAVPESWPQEPELDGGSLAFFYIDWRWAEGKTVEVQITPRTPEPTGFDWHGWVGRPEESVEPVGAARLETFLR